MARAGTRRRRATPTSRAPRPRGSRSCGCRAPRSGSRRRLTLGRHAALVGELEALVDRNPLRERLSGQLMLALYRSGRQAEALEAYAEARRRLVEELGIEPGPALQRLERSILNQDPALDLPEPPAPAPAEEPYGPSRSPRRRPARADGRTEDRHRPLRRRGRSTPVRGDAIDPETLEPGSRASARASPARSRGTAARSSGRARWRRSRSFGLPRVHEDDALRAVRAAIELRAAPPRRARARARLRGRVASGSALDTGQVDRRRSRFASPSIGGASSRRRAPRHAAPRRRDPARRPDADARRATRATPSRSRPAAARAGGCVALRTRRGGRRARLSTGSSAARAELEQLRRAFDDVERRTRRAALVTVDRAGRDRQVAPRGAFTTGLGDGARVLVGRSPLRRRQRLRTARRHGARGRRRPAARRDPQARRRASRRAT